MPLTADVGAENGAADLLGQSESRVVDGAGRGEPLPSSRPSLSSQRVARQHTVLGE